MDWIADPESWIAFFTLLGLEIVLGVDNVVFITILAGKLPESQQSKARLIGLGLAMLMRIVLLLSLSWIIGLTKTLFTVWGHDVSGRDIVMIVGGLFLLGKATFEIHDRLEGDEGHQAAKVRATFSGVIVQILLLDAVFSLDSVITAVGMAQEIGVMIAAVVGAVLFMMVFAGAVSRFVERHPTFKMLALSFLLLIGFTLVADGLGKHIPKGYIYFAMGFSLLVEVLNLRIRKAAAEPVKLHQPYAKG